MCLFFGAGGGKAQYKSAIWAQDAHQKKVATRLAVELKVFSLFCLTHVEIVALAAHTVSMLCTAQSDLPVLPSAPWHDAEEYHQKYLEKQRR